MEVGIGRYMPNRACTLIGREFEQRHAVKVANYIQAGDVTHAVFVYLRKWFDCAGGPPFVQTVCVVRKKTHDGTFLFHAIVESLL